MRGRLPLGMILLLATATVWLAADVSAPLAAGRESNRTETWEFKIPVRFYGSQTFNFDHGTSIDVNDDWGWGFGLGYNMNEHLNIDMEFAWTSASYNVKFAGAGEDEGTFATATGYLDATNTLINFTYYFQPKSVTAYLSAGIGWNWIDSNIPAGPPVTGCYWDPWYGYVCGGYQSTYSTTGFVYGLGAGVRIEPKDNMFIRLGLNDNWQDFGGGTGTPDILSYRLEMGWKF